MNNEIGIVTAFYDIGRGSWTPDKGFPHYLQRSTDTYFERFSQLAKLDNEMVVFTHPNFIDRIKSLRRDRPTKIYSIMNNQFVMELHSKILKIQSSKEYQDMIPTHQKMNPEYWNTDYVLINWLKSYFAAEAYSLNSFKDDKMIAWIDFGYCRSSSSVEAIMNNLGKWSYPFDRNKIHFWGFNPNQEKMNLEQLKHVIKNNIVNITGPSIVASGENWLKLYDSLFSLDGIVEKNLFSNNLVDDDQTLLTMFYAENKEMCEFHQIKDDWFRIFKDYSE